MFLQRKQIKATVIALGLVLCSSVLAPLAGLAQAPQEPVPATNTGTNLATYQQQYEGKILQLQAELTALSALETPADNGTIATILGIVAELLTLKMHEPAATAAGAPAAGQAQATGAANSAGDVARDQAITAIDYASRFMKNFTSEKGNKWNRLRDSVFVPIALLLLLPGAILTQVKCIVAAGAPIVGQTNPFEGIQRAIIAMFLIPGTYLIVNYGIDFANSVQYTVATEYQRLFGTDMYKDAICAQIRAFGVRYMPENEGSLQTPPPDQSAVNNGAFSPAEGRMWGKLEDPCSGLRSVPANRDDASMPASAVAARLMMNVSNASINTCWAILCAFQMAFFYYLYFVGPIMAALWVWPMKVFRDSFPSWVEGVLTLCFWSLFWHTTILLMACFKGTDDTGLFVMSALNFLATACVKHAFDFGGLVRAAGAKAAEMIEKAGKEGGGGGGGGGAAGQQDPLATEGGAGGGGAEPVSPTTFVTQQEVAVPMPEGGPQPFTDVQNMYLDSNQDGWVDGVWNSDTMSYDAPPDSMLLVSAAGPEAANFDMGLPPMTNDAGAPPVIVGIDGTLAFFDENTGTYTVPRAWDADLQMEVAQYVVGSDGRIAMWDGDSYVVPTEQSDFGDVDKFIYGRGYILRFNPVTQQYEPLTGNEPEGEPQVAPPSDPELQPNAFRDSIGSIIGASIEPVFALPVESASREDVVLMYDFRLSAEGAATDDPARLLKKMEDAASQSAASQSAASQPAASQSAAPSTTVPPGGLSTLLGRANAPSLGMVNSPSLGGLEGNSHTSGLW